MQTLTHARIPTSKCAHGYALIYDILNQTDKIAKKEADLKGKLQYYCTAISADLKITHQISQVGLCACVAERWKDTECAHVCSHMIMKILTDAYIHINTHVYI